MTMKVLATMTPVDSYINTLLFSMMYWIRREEGASGNIFSSAERTEFLTNAKASVAFIKQAKISLPEFKAFVNATAKPVNLKVEDTVYEDMYQHLQSLQQATSIIRTAAISDIQLDVLNKVRAWHKTFNTNTEKLIKTSVGKLPGVSKTVLLDFKQDAGEQKPYIADLRKLVKKLTGKDSLVIPMEDRDAIRKKFPDDWKQYNLLNRQINDVAKTEIRNFVRDNGGTVDIKDAHKHLKTQGILNKLPKGFVGKMDENGFLMTPEGVYIKAAGGSNLSASSIDTTSKVELNPNYDPQKDLEEGRNGNWYMKVVLTTKNAKGVNNIQYYYTETKAKLNKEHKFGVVQKLLKREDRMVRTWRKDLMGRNPEKSILGAICEVVYDTCARVGGKDNENKHGQTFGITTLTVGNVKRQGDKLILDYIGKDSVHQRHVLSPVNLQIKRVIQVIERLCKGKTKKDLLWEYKGVEYNATKLRPYFSTIAGVPGATPHKIRHLRGTRLATQVLAELTLALDKSRKPISQSTIEKAFKDAILNVGSMLGHVKGVGTTQTTVWSTAAKNYIDPSVMYEFFDHFKSKGIRQPKFLATLN